MDYKEQAQICELPIMQEAGKGDIMDERTYFIIFIVLIGLAAGAIIITIITTGGLNATVQDSAYGVNRNISQIGPTTANAVNNALMPLTVNLSNSIKSINPVVSNAIGNVTRAVSNATASLNGVNKNITDIGQQNNQILSNQGTQTADIIDTTEVGIANANAIANLTRYVKGLNATLGATTGLGWLKIWTMNQSASADHWLESQMLDTFANHINVTATNAINISVLTLAQYVNLSTGNSYSKVNVYTSSGSSNNINFYFNTSEGCSAYLYVIRAQNSLQPFVLYPNITAKYQPTASLQGVC